MTNLQFARAWCALAMAAAIAMPGWAAGSTAPEKTARAAKQVKSQALEPSVLSVDQVLEKNAAARGGSAAWRAVNAVTYKGELDAGGKKDMMLPFTSTLQRPNRSRMEIRFEEQTAVQVYDGKQGWKVRPFLNRNEVEPYTVVETKSAADWDELDGPLIDHARKGIRVELLGMEPVEGKSAFKLALTSSDGRQRNLWIDAQSFLEVKIDGEPRKLDAKVHNVAVYYRDYKAEGGLMIPHLLETAVQGVSKTRKMTIQSVSINPVLDAASFAKPKLTAISSAR